MTAKNTTFAGIPPGEWDKRQIKRGASFLQSAGWGKFQESLGVKVHYLMQDNWSCLLLERHTLLGNYLFAPYGPTVAGQKDLKESLKALKDYGRRNGIDWLSLEPVMTNASIRPSELKELGGRLAPHNREPDLTRLVDLDRPPNNILATISQSTRSFIRKNQREQFLKFRTSTTPADIELFSQMLAKVTARKNVIFFPAEYFQKQAEILMPTGMMFLELALANNKPVASAVIHDFGDQSTYTYAASLPEARSTNASALLLWQVMLNAKARGRQSMDLYGIAPDDAPAGHPWAGFSSFKKKFGGQVIALTGTWDFPLSGKYRLYRSAQRTRRVLRRH